MARARAVLAEVQYVVGLPPRVTSITTMCLDGLVFTNKSVATLAPAPIYTPDPGLHDDPPSKPA